MACKTIPFLQVLLYNRGSEPYFGAVGGDRGSSWYSNLKNEFPFGRVSFHTGLTEIGLQQYTPLVEYLGGERIRTTAHPSEDSVPIGLVLRPFIVPQDMADWISLDGDSGTWDYARPYSTPPTLRLVQSYDGVTDAGDTDLDGAWGKRSPQIHPENPTFAFSLALAEPSPDYDETVTGVAYTEFAWSSRAWAIRFYHHGNPVLLKSIAGVMQPVLELGSPGRASSHGDDLNEIVGVIRVQRGSLCISLDAGATYDVWWEYDRSAVRVPSGFYQFSGAGSAASLGVHQAIYYDGSYASPSLGMERSRVGSPAIQPHGGLQQNTSLTVDYTGSGSVMGYRANLHSGSLLTDSWTYYFSPELYTVELEFPAVSSLYFPIHDGGTTFEGRIMRATIEHPEELDQSTFDMTLRYAVGETVNPQALDLRLIKVYGGWMYSDGSNDATLLFTGYIVDAKESQRQHNRYEITVTAHSTRQRPEGMKWRDADCLPYDNLTPNQSLLKWALSMGLDASFIRYDASGRGDSVLSPTLFPENPLLLPVAGEGRWKLMQEIAESARLELGTNNAGQYILVPNDAWNFTPYTWQAAPASDNFSFIDDYAYDHRILETATAVQVRGKTQFNEQISAWIVDTDAEQNIFSPRFRPWPEWHIETKDKPTNPQWLAQLAISLAYKKMMPHDAPAWSGEFAPFLSRRDAVWIQGISTTGAGATTMQVGVETYRHTFDRSAPKMAWTELTGRRLQ